MNPFWRLICFKWLGSKPPNQKFLLKRTNIYTNLPVVFFVSFRDFGIWPFFLPSFLFLGMYIFTMPILLVLSCVVIIPTWNPKPNKISQEKCEENLTPTQNRRRIPIFREYLLGLGVNSVSKESIGGNFRRGPGASVTLAKTRPIWAPQMVVESNGNPPALSGKYGKSRLVKYYFMWPEWLGFLKILK